MSDNCEDSPKLEPIAVYYSFGAGEENGCVTMRMDVGHADYREPLVRASDVRDVVVQKLKDAEACKYDARMLAEWILEELDFTQKGENAEKQP